MIKRYLGNKRELIPNIIEAVGDCVPQGSIVGDLFSGTMSVSLAFKEAGYNVIANDINLFSSIIGDAYLVNNEVPSANIDELVPKQFLEPSKILARSEIQTLGGSSGFLFLESDEHRERYLDLLTLLMFLSEFCEQNSLPSEFSRSFIFDCYCEEGSTSEFLSSRGTSGRRRFFSPQNAQKIDNILNHIRMWKREALISQMLYSVLCCVLMRGVERVSNTQGTFHDFPRTKYDPRSLSRLRLEAPSFDIVLSGGTHMVGRCEDSLEYAEKLPHMGVLYLDPPYNFRQYTSYYFMYNLLCRYSDLEDLDSYFSQISFVRGQNMNDDFSSTFCKKNQFIDSLKQLVTSASSDYVVLSYFNGTNHWNDFKKDCNGQGYEELVKMFSSDYFEDSSLEVRPVKRVNYQSYGGYKAQSVEEYLFIAKRKLGANNAVA
ncbi:DNA adenine methylase [Vreelandella populi]|uniref:DNA adenine methylase n=1 Tax=Vreelandella populi TaxID=2498858 RepID=UPI000F8E668E|nr:DNA adenine methylase [Halomonas populi]RUR36655.1 hypothetical protein ELY25_13510 [Halomonas populi]